MLAQRKCRAPHPIKASRVSALCVVISAVTSAVPSDVIRIDILSHPAANLPSSKPERLGFPARVVPPFTHADSRAAGPCTAKKKKKKRVLHPYGARACCRAVYLACIPDIAELAAADVAAAHAAAGAGAPTAPTAAVLERVLEAAWGQ
jgi:hypothetical protein